ncbi:hypothetical protein ACFQS7_29395 [Dankookia sp. GCM10030260]|uniref:hypothetical protein n=1 Tax=Dankookia sp. GCM10030260 TaxID=3273390 RepID=UPI00360B4095
MTDPDQIGPDGRVRLRCCLTSADSLWFAAGCQERQGCGHSAPMGIRAAIRLMGPEATVGDLERRLRCSRCGNRQVGVTVHPDTRPPEMRESEGPRPETRAGPLEMVAGDCPLSRPQARRLELVSAGSFPLSERVEAILVFFQNNSGFLYQTKYKA